MLRSTLIYPNLHFTDDQTIKESLLLYDKLYRIVPEEITPKDSDKIKKFNDDYNNIIKNISPKKYVMKVSNDFKNNLDRWRKNASGMMIDPDNPNSAILYEEKVYDKLQQIFIDEGYLAYRDGYLIGNDELIHSYMTYLALEMSTKNNLDLVTYHDNAWTCQEYLNYDGQFAGITDEDAQSLVALYLYDYIPKNIYSVSFDKIMKFRDKYEDQRKNLLKVLSEFQKELEGIDLGNIKSDTIEDQVKELHNQVKDFKDACSYFKIDKFFGVRVVTVPAVIQGAVTYMNDPKINAFLVPFGFVLGGLWGLYSINRDVKELKKKNPYSYLVSLEELKTKRKNWYITKINENIKEFIED